jgi:DNA-binding NtrC family response regulator
MAAQLMERGFDVLTTESGDSALSLVEASPVDVVVVDFELAGFRGDELVQRLRALREGLEVVVLAQPTSADASVCLTEGAFLLLTRPLQSAEVLAAAVHRAGERKRLLDRVRQLDRQAGIDAAKVEVVATSRAMRAVVDTALGAANLRSALLLIGEEGTGKRLLARAVHQRSHRADRPFVHVRCGLVASSAADQDWLAPAVGGTLFLEEVADLAPALQARLLDILDAGEPDVRVIAAHSGELKTRVDEGSFRRDLFYRLQVSVVRVPPLRRRKDDIPVLAYHLLHRSAQRLGKGVRRISPEALRVLRSHDWPGNVGELASVIERAVAAARDDLILPGDLDQARETGEGGDGLAGVASLAADVRLPAHLDRAPFAEAKRRFTDAFEKAYVQAALRRSGGNIAEAAQQSGLDRSNFRRIMKRQRLASGGRGRSDGADD